MSPLLWATLFAALPPGPDGGCADVARDYLREVRQATHGEVWVLPDAGILLNTVSGEQRFLDWFDPTRAETGPGLPVREVLNDGRVIVQAGVYPNFHYEFWSLEGPHTAKQTAVVSETWQAAALACGLEPEKAMSSQGWVACVAGNLLSDSGSDGGARRPVLRWSDGRWQATRLVVPEGFLRSRIATPRLLIDDDEMAAVRKAGASSWLVVSLAHPDQADAWCGSRVCWTVTRGGDLMVLDTARQSGWISFGHVPPHAGATIRGDAHAVLQVPGCGSELYLLELPSLTT